MMSTATILIERDRDEVYDFVSNPINMDRWVDGLSGTRLTSPGEVGEGTTFESKYTYGAGTYDMRFEVTAFEPPRTFETTSEEGPFPFKGRVTLEKDGDGTQVSSSIEVGADGIFTKVMFTVFAPLMRRAMRKQLRKELEVLRSRLDAS
jgi:carbon monoxide dehydrogenase subunit G